MLSESHYKSIGIYDAQRQLRIGLIQSEKNGNINFQGAANSVVRCRIWPNFKLIQTLMYVIITCKYEMDPIKNNREKVATPFFKL